MSDYLFDEFDEVSAKQWKQKIQVDLKGDDYNQTLVWESNEGISVKPFYHQDSYEALEIPKTPGTAAIGQSIFISDEKTANFLAIDALKRGASSILFEAHEPFDPGAILKDLHIDGLNDAIHFNFNFLDQALLKELVDASKGLPIYLNLDPIGNLAKSGNWFYDRQKDFQAIADLVNTTPKNIHVLSVDASLYQNAGANCVQQLAYALAHVNEYLNVLPHENLELVHSIQFRFSVGSNYFFEIAKLRAFRYLWSILCQEYKLDIAPHIFVTPSLRNKTIYDFNSNMLRTTTECMSALLGGANTVSNLAYDSIYHRKNEFGERISRNQLLILQEESHFKDAAGFAEGSYYIEALTKQLSEKALTLFQDIEKAGGFLKQLTAGTIQRKIAESAEKEQQQFDQGEEILIGTNKYQNDHDAMKETIELYPFVKVKPRRTSIQPIVTKRLAEELEKQRLENE